MTEQEYARICAEYNGLLERREITHERYMELHRGLTKKMADEALARAKYKVGDILIRTDRSKVLRVEKLKPYSPPGENPWDWHVGYEGQRLTLKGVPHKVPQRVWVAEGRAIPYYPEQTTKKK